MKKIILSILLLNVLALGLLTGCGTKYCAVSGCPQEARRSNYCIYHKCLNYHCNNQRLSGYSYCEKCIERSLD